MDDMNKPTSPKKDDVDFDAMLDAAEQKAAKIAIGDRVAARVVRVGRDYVFLDVGSRTEGLLMREEGSEAAPSVGDRIDVFVTAFRDGAVICGRTVTSRVQDARAKDKQTIHTAIREAYDAGMPVEGLVKEAIKGGFNVNIMGERAFCPISQIDRVYCDNPEAHVGRSYAFDIIKLDEGGRNIVVSRRSVLEREHKEQAAKTWRELEVGGAYKGKVTAIKPYGAFVDLGGVEGMIHVSELGYLQVEDPKDVLQLGQEVEVAVKSMDTGKGRVSLSLKALMDDPWNDVAEIIHPNDVLKGTVRRIANFGAFVELKPGVDGLVHISAFVKDKRINSPREVVREGQEVEVRVLEVDASARRISLTMILAEDKEDDWREALDEVQSSGKQTSGMGTLGDLLGGKMKK